MTYGIGIYEPIYSQYEYQAGRYTTNNSTNATLAAVSTLPTNLNARDQIEICVSSSVQTDGNAPRPIMSLRGADGTAFNTDFTVAFNADDHFDKTAYKRYETMTDASADLVTHATSKKLLLSIEKENTAGSQTYSWVFALNVMRVRG